ncbi:hypothetical protein Lalb_Chr19g0139911 [Lupinus albus]|uniref:Uncharacterized protein n=1 Tax=Lupinus albus TaxID=3870 RepID=A0A6A4NIE9_LUPAL|nr:hypothetical protein Lalb_Chr19g0139911 [Lupinus albus]
MNNMYFKACLLGRSLLCFVTRCTSFFSFFLSILLSLSTTRLVFAKPYLISICCCFVRNIDMIK